LGLKALKIKKKIKNKKPINLKDQPQALGANFVRKYYYFDEIHIVGSK
jgi:hypothetical protein